MKLKLDENLSRLAGDLIRAAGHDAVTVADQEMRGATDETLFEACQHEGRTLVKLDRDFGQVLRFPPAASAGIVILELGRRATHAGLLARVRELLRVLETESPEGALWIVEPGRLRIHLSSDEDGE